MYVTVSEKYIGNMSHHSVSSHGGAQVTGSLVRLWHLSGTPVTISQSSL